MPYKPTPRLKPAFNSPCKDERNKGPVLHKQFNYDLKEMFYEKGVSGQCYKSFAKWDLRYDKEYAISDLIQRGAIEFDETEPPSC